MRVQRAAGPPWKGSPKALSGCGPPGSIYRALPRKKKKTGKLARVKDPGFGLTLGEGFNPLDRLPSLSKKRRGRAQSKEGGSLQGVRGREGVRSID